MDVEALRIIDANCNRAREAIRVIEDVLRFRHREAGYVRRLKRERHLISRYCDRILKQNLKGLKARDVAGDPGRGSMPRGESRRGDLTEILMANFRRAEESLRVLEEVSKLADVRLSKLFKRSRFRVYELEKTCLCSGEVGFGKD